MKKKIIIFFILLFIPFILEAKGKIDMYLFYGQECPHCEEMREFLNEYLKDNSNVTLHEYEVWHNENNKSLFQKVQNKLNVKRSSVPYLVISDKVIIGYSQELTDESIISSVNYYKKTEYKDYVKTIIDNPNIEERIEKQEQIKQEQLSLVEILSSGIKHSFDKTTIWYLILLISILLCVIDNKKRIIISTILLGINIISNVIISKTTIIKLFLDYTEIIKAFTSFLLIIFSTIIILNYLNTRINKKDNNKLLIISSIIIAAISFVLINIINTLCTDSIILNNCNLFNTLLYSLSYNIDDILLIIVTLFILNVKQLQNSKIRYLIGSSIIILIAILLTYNYDLLLF